jgi:hypothetical protein
MSNIAIVSHGFREGAKAMSKTARSCSARVLPRKKQHPAILPWPSSLALNGRAMFVPSLKSAAGALPDETADELCIRLTGARTMPRAWLQRRMPRRSINDL